MRDLEGILRKISLVEMSKRINGIRENDGFHLMFVCVPGSVRFQMNICRQLSPPPDSCFTTHLYLVLFSLSTCRQLLNANKFLSSCCDLLGDISFGVYCQAKTLLAFYVINSIEIKKQCYVVLYPLLIVKSHVVSTVLPVQPVYTVCMNLE